MPVLRAAGAVLGDLADVGYDAQWATVAASDVGAPHRRERVFILASAADADSQRRVSQEFSGEWCRHSPALTAIDHHFPAALPQPSRVRCGRCQQCDLEPSAGSQHHSGTTLTDVLWQMEGISDAPVLPTPRATDGTKGGPNQRGSSGDLMLPSAVMNPSSTPTHADIMRLQILGLPGGS